MHSAFIKFRTQMSWIDDIPSFES